jgi:hypothetical protein
MPYYSIVVFEKRKGARRRRRMAVASNSDMQAKIAIHDICRGTGFVPDYATLDEINYNQYLKLITIFFGRKIYRSVV